MEEDFLIFYFVIRLFWFRVVDRNLMLLWIYNLVSILTALVTLITRRILTLLTIQAIVVSGYPTANSYLVRNSAFPNRSLTFKLFDEFINGGIGSRLVDVASEVFIQVYLCSQQYYRHGLFCRKSITFYGLNVVPKRSIFL